MKIQRNTGNGYFPKKALKINRLLVQKVGRLIFFVMVVYVCKQCQDYPDKKE